MASTTMKAAMSIVRLAVALIGGGLVGYMLDQTAWTPEVSIGGGLVSAVMIFLLLSKLSGSGGSD